MISTNELSFPMPASNLIAQRDPMRFVDTALYADDCAAESVTLVRQTLWLLMPADVFPPSH